MQREQKEKKNQSGNFLCDSILGTIVLDAFLRDFCSPFRSSLMKFHLDARI